MKRFGSTASASRPAWLRRRKRLGSGSSRAASIRTPPRRRGWSLPRSWANRRWKRSRERLLQADHGPLLRGQVERAVGGDEAVVHRLHAERHETVAHAEVALR